MVFRRFSVLLVLGLMILAACSAPAANAPAAGAPAAAPTAAPDLPAATSAPTAVLAPTTVATAAPALTSPAPAGPAPTTAPPAEAPTAGAAAEPTATTAPASSASGPATLRLVIQPEGTEARYRVREQIMGRDLPSDAVGKTNAVSGAIVIRQDGTLVPDESRIVVDVSTLKSDEGRRDNFIRRNTLETGKYPQAEFVPHAVQGLPSPLPTSGEVRFELTGDMTAHGVTKPMTWQVTGKIEGQQMTGTATTSFKFGDFGMDPPRVPVLLSLEDNIKLELDFTVAHEG